MAEGKKGAALLFSADLMTYVAAPLIAASSTPALAAACVRVRADGLLVCHIRGLRDR
jgi:hypothetical protein